ncbi:MAG: FHA domain-containing protein [Longimonas sp.]|uniref:FHA domain-containing protein n=1 Tax=Longimonas sp. TaxID=2039626 RepID=UPI00334CBD60
MRFAWLAVAFLAFIGIPPVHAQTSISDILDNPGQYNDAEVTVQGTVERLVDGEGDSIQNYIIASEAGDEIRVRFSSGGAPEEGQQLEVAGLVSISAFNREPFIIESSRSSIDEVSQGGSRAVEGDFDPFTILGIIGLIIALVVGGAGFYLWKRDEKASEEIRKQREKEAKEAEEAAKKAAESVKPANEDLGVQDTELQEADEDAQGSDGTLFPDEKDEPSPDRPVPRIKSESSSSVANKPESPETLKFKAPPKTMKFIPGKLVIISGPDKGREFRIAGFPREEDDGNVVTIGRADVKGERAFAHIQLGDTYRTVSRIQAEIIQKTSDNEILLRNKSTTNPTRVNEEEVPPEETVELQNEDTIQMGELVLQYEV